MGLPEDELLDELDDELLEEELLDDELLLDELLDDELLDEELLVEELELLEDAVPEVEPEEVDWPPQPAISIAITARGKKFLFILIHQKLTRGYLLSKTAHLSKTAEGIVSLYLYMF